MSRLTTSSELGIRLTKFCETMEKELVSRCIKVFRFEPHGRKKTLLILGEITVTILIPATGRIEQQIVEDFKKPIHLIGLSNSVNSEKIAKEILTMCPFIDNSMRDGLVDIIEEIKLRDYDQNGIVVPKEIAADGSFLPRFPEIFEDFADENIFDESNEEPDFGKLDNYVDLLYEDIPSKIEASSCLAKLTKCNSYLKDISKHDSAMNALFRTLREDSKKSSTLTKHILTICLNFAKIRDFHALLIKQKMPALILEIIDYELERCEKWKTQLIEVEAEASNNRAISARSLNECHSMWVRLTELTSFQNTCLIIAFQILHCLSEDTRVRENLFEHKLITSLSETLERRDNHLLEEVISFLTNLSSFKQCVDQMIDMEVVNKLAAFLKEGSPIPKKIVNHALHVLYNLSFSPQLRQNMCDCGLILIISNCFDKVMFRDITAKLLYVLSMDPLIRIKLIKPALIDSLMCYLTADIETDANTVPTVVASLVLNLSRSKRGAKLIWETGKLGSLIKSALCNQNFFSMKIARSLAEYDVAFILYDSAGDIAKTMINSSDQEFVMECIGVLTCLDLHRISLESIIQKGKIFPWLKQTLGYYLDKLYKRGADVTFDLTVASIDVILLLRNIAQIEEGARLVVAEGFMDVLLKILHSGAKAEESVVDHIFFLVETCTRHESISIYLATKSRLPTGLLEFAEGTTGKQRQMAILVLEQIGRFDESWKENVQQFNFLTWNKDWTDTVSEIEEDVIQDAHPFRFHDDSCTKSRDVITSLAANTLEQLGEEGCYPWLTENSNEFHDSSLFDMFRHQFEEEMGFNSDYENDEFWAENSNSTDTENGGDR